MRRRATVAALVALAVLGSTSALAASDRPARREYDTHTYYVVEVDHSRLAGSSLEDVADVLGAEHVERVGALDNHFLIRAPVALVAQGEPVWASVSVNAETLSRRDGCDERDAVLERYALLRRGVRPTAPRLRARGSASSPPERRVHRLAIRSVERQYPRQRVKRDLPTLPPDSDLPRRSLRRPARPLGARQTTPGPSLSATFAQLFSILDPLWPKQWHLVNDVLTDNSINVTGVWSDGILGEGVNVAIVDDGLDMHSDDLSPNFHADGSWDYNDNTALPEPRLADDQHGTRCAGEIAAAKNDVCGVGVAHKAGIAGIRILSAAISDADEASALNYGYQTNAIYSCSWGPPDDGKSMEAPGPLIVEAMLAGVQKGRGGKGSIFVFASGNGGGVDDQCNFDGYTNSLMSITVGAIDRKNMHPFYSEACAANMVVTYSSGSGDNIHTTDVGKNACTDRHGGTSAAAPIAAGIFALVLQVRPDLTWRDMQHLCVQTAVQINPTDPDWQMTASGRKFNHKYGFGKLDAWAIVNAAKTYTLAKPQAWWTSPESSSGMPLTPDGALATIEVTAADLADANFELLEHVTITVHIDHQRRGNVEVELLSPRGMKSILARPRRFDEDTTGIPNWVFMTVKHWDEDPVGTWTLRVRDRQTNGKTGVFNSWSMQLWGSSIDASKATLWKPPRPVDDDDHDSDEVDDETEEPTPIDKPASPSAADDEATKMFPKPTAHLPEDHAESEGEAHSHFGDPDDPAPTSAPVEPNPATPDEDVDEGVGLSDVAGAIPTDSPGADDKVYNDDFPGYLSGMKNLLGSSTWMFVAGGTILVFLAGVTAFFVLRRRPRAGRGGGYDFAPQTDEEDGLPMSALNERKSLAGGPGSARTRELYDAFRLDSDEEDESDGDGDDQRPLKPHRVAYKDEAMASFHDDAPGSLEIEKIRTAREEFSD